MAGRDFLDELIEERSARNAEFPRILAEAEGRRAFAQRLAAKRRALSLSQTYVAAKMHTSQSVVSKLEKGADVRVSTMQRYCALIGEMFLETVAHGARAVAKQSKRDVRSRKREKASA